MTDTQQRHDRGFFASNPESPLAVHANEVRKKILWFIRSECNICWYLFFNSLTHSTFMHCKRAFVAFFFVLFCSVFFVFAPAMRILYFMIIIFIYECLAWPGLASIYTSAVARVCEYANAGCLLLSLSCLFTYVIHDCGGHTQKNWIQQQQKRLFRLEFIQFDWKQSLNACVWCFCCCCAEHTITNAYQSEMTM